MTHESEGFNREIKSEPGVRGRRCGQSNHPIPSPRKR